MNKEILKKAIGKIKENKYLAEQKAKENLSLALSVPTLKSLYDDINMLKLNYIKNNDKNIKLEIIEKQNKFKKLLKTNFNKDLILKPVYNCKYCSDTGYVNGKICDCVISKMKEINISNYNKEINFNNFNNDTSENLVITKKLKKWCENFNSTKIKNINMFGETGVGKTFFAECIANEILNKNQFVLFTTAFNLNQEFLKFHSSFEKDKFNILNPFIECDLLIIDDLGTENIFKNVTLEYLFNILNERKLKNKSTVITSNLSLSDLRDRYGERIFSRICDKNDSLTVKLNNEDIRLKKNS